MKCKSVVIGLAYLVLLSGCSSMPLRHPSLLQKDKPAVTLGTVAIMGCEEPEISVPYELNCAEKSNQLASALTETGLFSEVFVGDRAGCDYEIYIKYYKRHPFWQNIGHNPGLFCLSIVVPFWERYAYGYEFDIQATSNDAIRRVNTLAEGTHIMWSASVLFNILPSRGMPGTFYDQEAQHLRYSIAEALQ